MFKRCLKMMFIGGIGLCVVGGLLFGKDVLSYAYSSAKSVQRAVKDSVPIEFELSRARDLLDQIIPEMHANIRMIAQEEVEIAALKTDIEKSQRTLEDEQQRIKKLRSALEVQQASYTFGGRKYDRDHVKQDLANRFELFKEAELVYASKEKLLVNREKSLQAAMQMLEKTRSQKRLLEDKIGALEGKHRLVKAASIGSQINIDNSKLAQTEKLIAQIKKRLDVAERVLAHESKFVQSIPVDTITEKELIAQIDEHFAPVDDSLYTIEPQVVTALPKSER